MELRPANLNDVPDLVQIGQAFIKEAPNYQNKEYLPEKAAEHFKQLIKGAGVVLLAIEKGVIVGGFVGRISHEWFSNKKVAFDDVLYVKPEFRKTRVAYLLVQAFIHCAQLMGANSIQCGTTTGVESEACINLYQHFGFEKFGTVMNMELKA